MIRSGRPIRLRWQTPDASGIRQAPTAERRLSARCGQGCNRTGFQGARERSAQRRARPSGAGSRPDSLSMSFTLLRVSTRTDTFPAGMDEPHKAATDRTAAPAPEPAPPAR